MTTDNHRPGPPSTGRRRDRYQLAVVAVTGVATAGCLTATGWIVGQAADTWAAQQQPAPATVPTGPLTTAEQPVSSRPRHRAKGHDQSADERVVLRERPTRTRVTTRYVRPAAPVGGGGSVSSTPSQPHSNPAPAPSSGS